ncbi:hypothetical protein D3C76_1399200 [compost metagenome]
MGMKFSTCRANAAGKPPRMNSVGPNTTMNSARPIISQTLISLTKRMPLSPTRHDTVYISVTRTMVSDWVRMPLGTPHTACRALLICSPRKPIGPMVPATTAMIEVASARVPIGPFNARSPNRG